MIPRILPLSLVFMHVTASNATPSLPPSSPPPPDTSGWQTWEIALAAGSGGVAVLLLLYAFMMRPRKEKEVADVEAGKKKQVNEQIKPDVKAGTSMSQVKLQVDKNNAGTVTKAPAAKAPAAKAPAVKAPAVKAPAAKAPSVKVPVEDAPKSMTGKIIAATH